MGIEVSIHKEPGFYGEILTAKIPNSIFENKAEAAIYAAFDKVAERFASDFIQKNLTEIYSAIDVKAISNIVLLEVTKQVKNNIMGSKK